MIRLLAGCSSRWPLRLRYRRRKFQLKGEGLMNCNCMHATPASSVTRWAVSRAGVLQQGRLGCNGSPRIKLVTHFFQRIWEMVIMIINEGEVCPVSDEYRNSALTNTWPELSGGLILLQVTADPFCPPPYKGDVFYPS